MKAFAKINDASQSIELIDVPIPKISDSELLIKVQAIGVGIHYEYFLPKDINYPYVIGIEAAGVIEQIGTDIKGPKPGDRITFISAMQPKGGTWAEYAAISAESLLLRIPDNMTNEQAAAIPVAANTALKALAGAGLSSGDSLLVAGGAGAIGTLLIQLAKARGLIVIASASQKNHKFMLELGADHAVDYRDNDWQKQVKELVPSGVDAAIAIHPGSSKECQAAIKDNGTLIAVSGDNFETERGIMLKGVFNDTDVTNELNQFVQQVALGKMKLTIAEVYPFNSALKALEQVKTRHTRGKLVISLDASSN